jgi:hypothetical protein
MVYLMFIRVIGWMALLARCSASNDTKLIVHAMNSLWDAEVARW